MNEVGRMIMYKYVATHKLQSTMSFPRVDKLSILIIDRSWNVRIGYKANSDIIWQENDAILIVQFSQQCSRTLSGADLMATLSCLFKYFTLTFNFIVQNNVNIY